MANIQEDKILEIVRQVMNNTFNLPGVSQKEPQSISTAAPEGEVVRVRTGVSNRHVHLDQNDLEVLFGTGHELTVHSPLSQEGMFAANEKVILVGPKGCLTGVRVLGPLRKNTQIEISFTDARQLGVIPPVMQSGMVGNTPELTLVGPAGTITNHNAVMVAQRHIHMDTHQAAKWGFKDGDIVRVRTSGSRSVVFENVVVRTGDNWVNEFHIDTDEGNTANIRTGDMVEVIR